QRDRTLGRAGARYAAAWRELDRSGGGGGRGPRRPRAAGAGCARCVVGARVRAGACTSGQRALMAEQQGNILIVEDNPDLAYGLRTGLEIEGYEVAVAEDGETGLARARQWLPDLVILDLMLP